MSVNLNEGEPERGGCLRRLIYRVCSLLKNRAKALAFKSVWRYLSGALFIKSVYNTRTVMYTL